MLVVGEHVYYLLITYPHTSFLLPLICGHREAMLDHNAVQVPSGHALADCVTEKVVTVAERTSAVLLRFSFPRSP